MKKSLKYLVLIPFLLSGCSFQNPPMYTVSFDTKGGSYIEPQKVRKGFKVVKPENPTKEKYSFDYWSYQGRKYSFDNLVKKDITLEANWINLYSVNIFCNEEGLGTVSGAGNYFVDDKVEITALPNETSSFEGWFADEEYTDLISDAPSYTFTMTENDVCFYAKFHSNKEKEQWDVDHGVIPFVDITNNVLTYGLFPQSNVNDETLIKNLNTLTNPNRFNWYLYENEYYTKVVAHPQQNDCRFNNGDLIVEGNTYWFKCERISWNILTNDSNEYFVLSEYLLVPHRYDDSSNNYKESEVRSWLNHGFFDEAFYLNPLHVLSSTVDNSAKTTKFDDNPYASESTLDKVYMLSYQDYMNPEYGFSTDDLKTPSRQCRTTDWARANGAASFDDDPYLYNGYYWTRSPYNTENTVSSFYQNGGHFNYTYDLDIVCPRPCIRVNIG